MKYRYEVTASIKGDPMVYRVVVEGRDVFAGEWLGLHELFDVNTRFLGEAKEDDEQ